MSPATVESRQSEPRLDWMDWTLLLFIPPAAWLLLDINLWNQAGYVDPWFYTGIGQAFEELVRSYGWTYYYLRFPVVFANTLCCGGDHPALGYALLRYLLVLMAGGALYVMARKAFGRPAAVVGYVFLLANPLVLRNVLWDHPPFLSLTTALAGMALWLTGGRWHHVYVCLAGAMFALSANAHLFTATAIGCFGLAVVVADRLERRPWRDSVSELALAAGGCALAMAAGILYMQDRDGSFATRTLVRVNRDALLAGDSYVKSHGVPFLAWATTETSVYVPYLLTLAAWAMPPARGRGRREWAILLTATFYCAFYLYYRWVSGNFVLATFYYFVHLTVICYLLMPLLVDRVVKRTGKPGLTLAAALLSLLAPVGLIMLENTGGLRTLAAAPGSWTFLSISMAVALLAIAVVALGRRLAWATLVAFVALGSVVQVYSLLPGTSRYVYASPLESKELDIYRAGVQYIRLWRDYARAGERPLAWWKNGREDYQLYSIVFTALGDALHDKWGKGVEGMPRVGAYELERMREAGHRYLFLMATDPALIQAGKQSLIDAGVTFESREVREIAAGHVKAMVEVLAYSSPAAAR